MVETPECWEVAVLHGVVADKLFDLLEIFQTQEPVLRILFRALIRNMDSIGIIER